MLNVVLVRISHRLLQIDATNAEIPASVCITKEASALLQRVGISHAHPSRHVCNGQRIHGESTIHSLPANQNPSFSISPVYFRSLRSTACVELDYSGIAQRAW